MSGKRRTPATRGSSSHWVPPTWQIGPRSFSAEDRAQDSGHREGCRARGLPGCAGRRAREGRGQIRGSRSCIHGRSNAAEAHRSHYADHDGLRDEGAGFRHVRLGAAIDGGCAAIAPVTSPPDGAAVANAATALSALTITAPVATITPAPSGASTITPAPSGASSISHPLVNRLHWRWLRTIGRRLAVRGALRLRVLVQLPWRRVRRQQPGQR